MLFAVLFGTALMLIRTALPEGAEPGSQWVDGAATGSEGRGGADAVRRHRFLWFIGVVRDGFGRYEDKFFASVFLGSGLLFLAMMFAAVGGGRRAGGQQRGRRSTRWRMPRWQRSGRWCCWR